MLFLPALSTALEYGRHSLLIAPSACLIYFCMMHPDTSSTLPAGTKLLTCFYLFASCCSLLQNEGQTAGDHRRDIYSLLGHDARLCPCGTIPTHLVVFWPSRVFKRTISAAASSCQSHLLKY
eukprot:TRINITY_DN8347_c0_g1_i2.p2 TRINITY_DN8347_c0_g1~~TRINITY_DN8347_c0_g1_i2.p2  ORF type:complete len:122 (-),score=0.88 TRINITY_DN8347_c0_g1_i2:16-381(-)